MGPIFILYLNQYLYTATTTFWDPCNSITTDSESATTRNVRRDCKSKMSTQIIEEISIHGQRELIDQWQNHQQQQMSFVFIMIASIVITVQMVHLRDQIRERAHQQFSAAYIDPNTPSFIVQVESISLGSTVLGLTWAAVAAMCIETILWISVIGKARFGGPSLEKSG